MALYLENTPPAPAAFINRLDSTYLLFKKGLRHFDFEGMLYSTVMVLVRIFGVGG